MRHAKNKIEGLSSELIEQLRSDGVVRDFEEGEELSSISGLSKFVPLLLKGSMRVMRTDDDGRELLLYYLKPGEPCVMRNSDNSFNEVFSLKMVAEVDSQMLFVTHDKVTEFVKNHPELLAYTLKLYSHKLEELLGVVDDLAFKRMDERLWEFLLKKMEIQKSHRISITHEQVALELGTARVVISRLLKIMEEEGKLKLGRNKIQLM